MKVQDSIEKVLKEQGIAGMPWISSSRKTTSSVNTVCSTTMHDNKKSTWGGSLISRRRMLHYGLAGMAGIAGGFWPVSTFGETTLMSGTTTGGRSIIDMHALDFFHALSKQFPINKDVLDGIGLNIVDWEPSLETKDYECLPVLFKDGIIAGRIELRVIRGDKRAGMFLIFYLEGNTLPLADLNLSIGSLALYSTPRGHSLLEPFVYIYRIGKYSILAAASQQEPEVIISISFDSIVSIDNN